MRKYHCAKCGSDYTDHTNGIVYVYDSHGRYKHIVCPFCTFKRKFMGYTSNIEKKKRINRWKESIFTKRAKELMEACDILAIN